KFGIATNNEKAYVAERILHIGSPSAKELEFLDFAKHFFSSSALLPSDRASFVNTRLERLPKILRAKVDAIVGFQILQWLNADESGLPKQEIINAIAETLLPGGVFIGGTSTAFIQIDPTAQVDGKTKSEYSIDFHPFMQMVCAKISIYANGLR
ncbi:hypothetical protein HYT84_02280, partial [Candidatus Micrarchaeota archaeon]|nr:hypothetical protein [Candidatus Micrarchaeota archaeon]